MIGPTPHWYNNVGCILNQTSSKLNLQCLGTPPFPANQALLQHFQCWLILPLPIGPRRARNTQANRCTQLPRYLSIGLALPLQRFTLDKLKGSRPLPSQPPKLKLWLPWDCIKSVPFFAYRSPVLLSWLGGRPTQSLRGAGNRTTNKKEGSNYSVISLEALNHTVLPLPGIIRSKLPQVKVPVMPHLDNTKSPQGACGEEALVQCPKPYDISFFVGPNKFSLTMDDGDPLQYQENKIGITSCLYPKPTLHYTKGPLSSAHLVVAG